MAPSKIRRALGAVKDKTSIGLAKVGSSSSLSDLEVAIVKATRHEEHPAEERHVREILSLTCYSKVYISACVNTLSRRLNKTKNWTVALKTLMLIQRLVSDGDPAYEQEIFFSTRQGTRFLNMSDFRDASLSDSWDYSAFVRTYALYLDERLEFKMQSRRGKRSAFGADDQEEKRNGNYNDKNNDDNDNDNDNSQAIIIRATPVREMTTEHIFSRVQHLQQLLERFLACRPTGEAKNNRVVLVALYPIVKESFQIYYDITEIMGILIDRFMELNIHDCVKVYDIFCRVGKQFEELEFFYSWCKTIAIARSSEFPDVEKITPKKLQLMDDFIKEKSDLAQSQIDRGKNQLQIEITEQTEQEHEHEHEQQQQQQQQQDQEQELDINSVKALPPPEDFKEEETVRSPKEDKIKDEISLMGDLLNLDEDLAMTRGENSDKLELALFDGSVAMSGPTQTWQTFNDDTHDWETALVQSASHLSTQRADLGGGFDMLLLDGMYNQTPPMSTMVGSGHGVSGSASSMALGSAGRPAMLALPAPPALEGGANGSYDPFAASMSVAPPPYVQMSEMEKKQKLLAEEQFMWQQYARDGRQIQHNPYTGGFTHSSYY